MAYLGLNDKIASAVPDEIKETFNTVDKYNRIVNNVVSGDFSDIFGGNNAILEHRNDTINKFGIDSNHMLRPKPRPLFYVNFQTITQFDNKFAKDLKQASYSVKMVDRPSHTFELTTANEYNRKRVINGKMKYEPLQIIFYDTVDSSIMKILQMYKRFHYLDSSRFTNQEWDLTSMDTPMMEYNENPPGFGYHNYLDGKYDRNNYFFKQIDIFEFFDNKLTVYNIIHPRIMSITMDPRDLEQQTPSEIIVRFEYEGVTHRWAGYENDVIGQNITRDVANFVGIPWKGSILDPLKELVNELEDTLELAIGGTLVYAGKKVQNVIDGILTGPIEAVAEAGKEGLNNVKEALTDKFDIYPQKVEPGSIKGVSKKSTVSTIDW